MRVLLRNYPYVKVWSEVPDKGSRIETHNYALSLPKSARYSIGISFFPTHISHRGKETILGKSPHTYRFSDKARNAKSMFTCILGYKYDMGGFSEPSLIDCDSCEYACKSGRLTSPIEYGLFDEYVCGNCGLGLTRVWQFGAKCPNCGSNKTKVKCFGNPHVHGLAWVFELHVLDHDTSVALGEFLGVRFDDQLRFSCKGSWHNFRNDSSGFDICHVDCLNDLIRSRIHDNLTGESLFKSQYPEKGKILTGNNRIIKEWSDGNWI